MVAVKRNQDGTCPMFPTVRQAARHTRVSEHWIRDQIRSGALPIYRPEPQSWPRICLDELVELIRSTRRVGGPENRVA